ncbi:hypothetical protein Ahy_A07g036011 isoform A [Arachis hypogaea]|uniref:non-specific serine/threonine protein kinase n=2 Tax=Arachis hypogaea TaxID=3818 RepID=A0A445CF04_ARAHY|nr:hypothetical protein Ahy_A07g036011 isoform A [Arachis hypogaea]
MSTNKSHPAPSRNPPPPPSSVESKPTVQASVASRGGGNGGQLGAFWSTQHANDSIVSKEKSKPVFDEEPSSNNNTLKHDRVHLENDHLPKNVGTNKVVNAPTHSVKSSVHGKSHKPDTASSKDFELNFFKDKEFDTAKLSPGLKSEREEILEAEVEKLKGQLKEANIAKAEITSKYEKLSAICRSQRQELQDLKQALAAKTPSPNREGMRTSPALTSSASTKEQIGETVWELQQDKTERKTPGSEPKSWQAFPEEPRQQTSFSADNTSKSVRTRNTQQKPQPAPVAANFDSWGFGSDNFSAVRASTPQMPRPGEGSNSQAFGEAKAFEKKSTTPPAGWAGF